MADDFQTTETGSGELKDVYDSGKNSPLAEALSRKRKKLTDEKFKDAETP